MGIFDKEKQSKMPLEGKSSETIRTRFAYDLLSSPDNDDCMKKLLYGGGYGVYGGVVAGLLESLAKLKVFTPSTIGLSIAGWVGPLAAIGMAYPTLTCTIANMRDKDDVFNHAAAGFMSGSIYGIRYKKAWVAYLGAFSFGAFCAMNKYFHQKGYHLYSNEAYNVPNSNAQFTHYERSFMATRGPILGRQEH